MYLSPVLSAIPKEAADTHRNKQQVESPTAGGSKTALRKLESQVSGQQTPRSAANELAAGANHLHTPGLCPQV